MEYYAAVWRDKDGRMHSTKNVKAKNKIEAIKEFKKPKNWIDEPLPKVFMVMTYDEQVDYILEI